MFFSFSMLFQVYVGNDDHGAIVSTIPLVSESQLHHDDQGITYQNGAFLVMERFVLQY